MNEPSARTTFFRQSGWMAFAAIGGGLFNMATTFVAQGMPSGQFNIFDTALAALGILAIPGLGMQASFAAQASNTDRENRQAEVTTAMRGALGLLSVLWLLLAGWCVLRREQIMADYKLAQPSMLWVLLLMALVTLVTPVPTGVLQGRQDFLWLGWATLLNGVGRFCVLLAVVKGFGGGALGGMAPVLAGTALVLAVLGWRTWDVLTGPAGHFDWRPWLRRLLPVTVGLGALSVLMQADALIVREKLMDFLTADEVDGYSAVRKIAQAMVYLVGALTSVMFPKVARSFQRSEKTDVLKLTIALTAIIGVVGAILATLFPEVPLRVLSPARLLASKGLVTAYCWALLPLTLANVLVWSLLARESYRVVPWLAALALGYWITLQNFHDRLQTVIAVAAAFGSAFMLVSAAFLWLESRTRARASPPTSIPGSGPE